MTDNLTIFGVDYTGVTGIKAKGTGNGTLTYIRPTGTKSITENGTGIDVAAYSTVDVDVSVDAESGTMVIRDTQDSHGGTVREITAGSVVTGTKSITSNGTYDVAAYADASVNVPSPEPELQSKTATPTESQQTVTPDSGYDGLSSVTVGAISSTYVGSGVARRTASNLTASGDTVTVPAGYYSSQATKSVSSGTAGTPTATKGTVSNHSVAVTPSVTNSTGYITGGTKTGTAVTVAASELVSGTLSITGSGTKDVTNYASASVAAGSATASATKGSVSNHSVSVTPSVTRTAGYVTAGTANGTAVTVSASELVSGTYTVNSSGTKDVTNYASASVPSGSATASATKGTVSNHSVSVTPSVTRTAGYVTAGTANGTAVTVSASELVSGTLSVTENDTYDVTNYANVEVNVSGGASNLVQGTFTIENNPGGVQVVTLPYNGSGYPIAYSIYPADGFFGNTSLYNLLQRYAIIQLNGVKADASVTPTYEEQGTTVNINGAYVSLIYKNNATNALVVNYTGGAPIAFIGNNNAYANNACQVTFKNSTTMNVFIASTSYGFAVGIEYAYAILYSE